jgi:hypothetical protein
MSDAAVPSGKDLADFAALVAEHKEAAVAAFVLMAFVSILIGVTSKLPTWAAFIVAFLTLLFLGGAGGYAVYRVIPDPNMDTAVMFKLKLADDSIRIESFALNTYVGGVEGEATQRRVLYRGKDDPADWAGIRMTRICPPSEENGCPSADFKFPVWLLPASEARHFRDQGSGTGIVVSHKVAVEGGVQSCTVFPDPKPNVKPKTYIGPDLCATARPPKSPPSAKRVDIQPRSGSWWVTAAWASDTPVKLVDVRAKLASTNTRTRAEGRMELQKAANAGELLGRVLQEPAGSEERDRIVANALIAAIYFGDDKWKEVSAVTKEKIAVLLIDKDELVSRYAKSVLRRYPEESVLAKVREAVKSADGDQKRKLMIAVSDIEYNLGVVRLQEARASKTDMNKWQTAQDTFLTGIASGKSVSEAGKQVPDVTKNYFGLALSTADKWSTTKPSTMAPPQVTAAFSEFLEVVDQKSYPFAEQIEAATCVTKIGTSAEAQYEKSLGECLKFFR